MKQWAGKYKSQRQHGPYSINDTKRKGCEDYFGKRMKEREINSVCRTSFISFSHFKWLLRYLRYSLSVREAANTLEILLFPDLFRKDKGFCGIRGILFLCARQLTQQRFFSFPIFSENSGGNSQKSIVK